MGDNISGWGTGAPNQVGYRVGYQFWTPGQAMGAQFAQAKPKGAVVDGTQNWSLTSYNHNIYLDVASQRIEPPRVCRRLFCLSHAAIAGCSVMA